jgi:hypothetical protein
LSASLSQSWLDILPISISSLSGLPSMPAVTLITSLPFTFSMATLFISSGGAQLGLPVTVSLCGGVADCAMADMMESEKAAKADSNSAGLFMTTLSASNAGI